jgi:hypothetical protein
MKKIVLLILFQGCLLLTSAVFAQDVVPPLFGKDIVIQEQQSYNQRNVSVCSAYNGWLYSAYIVDSSSFSNFKVVRSKDNGISWEPIYTPPWWIWEGGRSLMKIDLVTCGNNQSNLKLIIGYSFSILGTSYMGNLMRLNGVTAEMENDCMIYEDQDDIRDIDLCSDGTVTESGSNPGAIGFLYSQENQVRIRISRDGGLSFNEIHVIATCAWPGRPEKVSLAYGSSPLWDSGRFFAIWNAKDYLLFPNGHVYYSHSEGDLATNFIPPVCIDSLNTSTPYQGGTPVISCQYGLMDNDEQNLTTLVMYEVPNTLTSGTDILAFYNKEATTSKDFIPFSFTNPEHDNQMPATIFNPYDSTFILTWYDKTLSKLPYATKEMNLSNPNSWNFNSEGYNDSPDLSEPRPKLCINPVEQSGACVWIRESDNKIGQAMFDAHYSTYTGVADRNVDIDDLNLSLFPNPATTHITVSFDLSQNERVSISLYDMLGRSVGVLENSDFCSGRHSINYDLRNIPEGVYLLILSTNHETLSKHLLLTK